MSNQELNHEKSAHAKITELHLRYRFHRTLEANNYSTQLFIDSRDVLQTILGMKEFTTTGTFNKEQFESDTVLIQSLIFGKWLNEFTIMVPHEGEVFYNIERYKTIVGDVEEDDAGELEFVLMQVMGIERTDLLRLSTKDFLSRMRSDSRRLYKFKYLLEIPSWRKRVDHLWGEDLCIRDDTVYNFSEIASTTVFGRIYAAFVEERPRRQVANLNDSMVLAILYSKLIAFSNCESTSVPIFYDSTGLFTTVLRKADLSDDFEVSLKGVKLSIIQDHGFFLLKALFLKMSNVALFSNLSSTGFKEMQAIRQKIVADPIDSEQLDVEFMKEISNFLDKKLIDIFWINEEKETIELLASIKRRLNQKDTKRKLKTELDTSIRKVQSQAGYYNVFRKTFSSLLFGLQIRDKRLLANAERSFSSHQHILCTFRDFGLTRFSLFEDTWDKLQLLVRDLFLRATHKHEVLNHELSIVGKLLVDAYMSPKTADQKQLGVGLAVLWILNRYDLIILIMDKLECDFEYYSLGFFHAAALAKYRNTKSRTDRALRTLRYIDTSRSKTHSFDSNYKMAIGASYIYYHLWESNVSYEFRSTSRAPAAEDFLNNSNHAYLLKAIQLAQSAIAFLEDGSKFKTMDHRKNKYYYILNNYIYYVTMGCPNSIFVELGSSVNTIEAISTTERDEFWQYRFDDTLSLYYLRKALSLDGDRPILKKKYLEVARGHSTSALAEVLTPEDLKIAEATSEKIDLAIAECDLP